MNKPQLKLAILGASRPHLPLYLKAHEMGLETYCIAWEKGAFCKDYADHFHDISIVEKEQIADLCRKEGINGIVANALEPAVPTVAYVAQECGFNGISYKAALQAVNKKEMRTCISRTGVCLQPEFAILKYGEPAPEIFPAIIKPTDSSCSNGVSKVSNQHEIAPAIERAMSASASKEILVEEFIEGREISVESISFHGRHHVLAITDKETTGAPYFVETAHHQPSSLPQKIQEEVRDTMPRLLDALELTEGASHAEFKITEDGRIYFIEIGARGGGDCISYDLVKLSTGYDFVKGMIEVALGKFTEPVINSTKYSGIYFLSQETYYIKDFIDRNKDKDWVVRYETENGPLKSLKKSQDRSGYIIYQSDHKINCKPRAETNLFGYAEAQRVCKRSLK